MPIYEFRCKQCDAVFEALRPMGDRGRSLECPRCGQRAPERIQSTFAACTGAGAGADGAAAGPGCGGGGFT